MAMLCDVESALLPPQRVMSVAPAAWNSMEWRQHAACTDVDVNLFFPIGVTGPAVDQIAKAKAVCRACSARDCCLEFALVTHQDYGVWGGATEDERRVMRRQRRAAARAAKLRAG